MSEHADYCRHPEDCDCANSEVANLRSQLSTANSVLKVCVEALEAARLELHCRHSNDDRSADEMGEEFASGHWCSMCDDSADRNNEVRAAIRAAIAQAKEAME